MKRKYYLIAFFVLFLCVSKTFSQVKIYNGQHLIFQESRTNNPVLIINDSVSYKGNSLRRFQLNKSIIPGSLYEYNPFFNINNKTFLVHYGCGPVLEYRNDSLVRIDNSFLHHNQFEARSFVYNNEIYFFGGYGLFNDKNILTKFDFNTKKWVEVQMHFEQLPLPRSSTNGIVINDNFYFFGGISKSYDRLTFPNTEIVKDDKLWRLHLPTMKLQKLGSYNKKINDPKAYVNIKAGNKLYLIGIKDILEVDIPNNIVKYYRSKINVRTNSIYFDNYEKKVVYVQYLPQKEDFVLVKESLEEFLGKEINNEKFVSVIDFNDWMLLIIAMVIIIIIIIASFYFIRVKSKQKNKLEWNEEENCFYFNNKAVKIFNEEEIILLKFLIENKQDFVPLKELNKLLLKNNEVDNYPNLSKKRDNVLSNLNLKLKSLLVFKDGDVFIYKKDESDKRLKNIHLNSELIRIKK